MNLASVVKNMIEEYMTNNLFLDHYECEVINLEPIKLKTLEGSKIILERQCYFLEGCQELKLEVELPKIVPDKVEFYPCMGHIEGEGKGNINWQTNQICSPIQLQVIKTPQVVILREPLKKGDHVIVTRLGDKYLVHGRVGDFRKVETYAIRMED